MFLTKSYYKIFLKVNPALNRPQNIRKVIQFYICLTSCLRAAQNRDNFAIYNYNYNKISNIVYIFSNILMVTVSTKFISQI